MVKKSLVVRSLLYFEYQERIICNLLTCPSLLFRSEKKMEKNVLFLQYTSVNDKEKRNVQLCNILELKKF